MDSEHQYQARLKRFQDAISLQTGDEIPVIMMAVHYFPTSQKGISNARAMVDHHARYQALVDFLEDYDLDIAPVSGIYPAAHHAAIGANFYQWPGEQLPDDYQFQYVEDDYMREDEYDQLLEDPTDYFLRILWPRLAGSLQPLTELPPPVSLGPLPTALGPYLQQDSFMEMLETLTAVGKLYRTWMEAEAAYVAKVNARGYPVVYGAAQGHAPFDLIANYMRGMRGVMLDMYRQPERLLAAVDLFTEPLLEGLIAEANRLGNLRVPLWLHRGSDSLMSDEQYQRFYWPSLRRVLLGLLAAGLTPLPYFQGEYTSRLPYLAELPVGKIPLHFDQVDRHQAREIIGGKNCFWGNIPASLLVTGSPEQIEANTLELLDLFAGTGGLIIDGAAFPDETKPENLHRMIETTHNYSG